MYQPQSHHYPPPPSSAGSVGGSSVPPLSASSMMHQVPPSSLPQSNMIPVQQQQMHPNSYNPAGGGAPPRSAARSMSSSGGHGGYLNGGLPDYTGGVAASLNHNGQGHFGQQPHQQRHNSGVGSHDNLGSSGNPRGSMQPQQHHHHHHSDPSGHHPKPWLTNTINEKNPGPLYVKAFRIDAKDGSDPVDLTIRSEGWFDRGAFGTVFKAKLINEESRVVAIKTVIQDKKYRNRELPLMKILSHPNIVTLFYFYFSSKEELKSEKSLNLVMEFIPKNVSNLIPRGKTKADRNSLAITPFTVKIVMYQIFRALSYIHTNGICHRDIKPNNLLFDPETGVLKVCDFGSAKQLINGERNVSYICARYYRAPELLFGATDYTNMIDLWSTGIVWSELLLGYPIFHENSGIDQLVNIISMLGTPTKEEIQAMNPDYLKYNLPYVERLPRHVILPGSSQSAADLIFSLFEYDPRKRTPPLAACSHRYFDELREPGKNWRGRELPELFNFTEFELSADPSLREALMPRTTPSIPPGQVRYHNSSIPIAIANPNATAVNNANSCE